MRSSIGQSLRGGLDAYSGNVLDAAGRAHPLAVANVYAQASAEEVLRQCLSMSPNAWRYRWLECKEKLRLLALQPGDVGAPKVEPPASKPEEQTQRKALTTITRKQNYSRR